MKRTNLVLDEQLLQEATRVLGEKTYSATVNRALEDAIRMKRIQSLETFLGQRLWEGDLSEMREDRPPKRGAKKTVRR
jgi:Arc/MetJ family transcription regulator